MALQTKTINANGSKGHHKFTLTITEDSTNVEHNSSSLSWSFVISPIVKGYDWESNSGKVKYSVVLNGTTYSGIIAKYDGKSTVTIKSETLTCAHDADGSKTINFSFSITDSTGWSFAPGSVSKNGTMTLTNIPRAATLLTATNFNDEENPTITYSNPAGNNVTTLQSYIYADDEKTLLVGAKNLTKTDTSFTYSLTESERKTLRTAATSNVLKVKFRIKTVIGSVTYWSDFLEKTMTIINANPDISMTVVDTNPDTLELTGDLNSIVKGYSTAYYEITASPRKESSIPNTGYSVTCNDVKKDTLNGSFENAKSNIFSYTVTDSRKNKTTDTVTKTLVDYVELTVNKKVSMTLVGETGATMTVNVNGKYFNDSFGAVDNTLVVSYRMATGAGDYTDWIPVDVSPIGNAYSVSFNIDGLSYEETYKIQVRAEDKLNTKDTIPYVTKLKPVFDWSENDFNFNVPVQIGVPTEEGKGWYDPVNKTGCGLDMRNTDIVNANSIYFADPTTAGYEGLVFPVDSSKENWDIVRAYNGNIYFVPNYPTNTKSYKLFYQAGDTITISSANPINGFITTGSTRIYLTIPLSKPVIAKSATISGTILVRGISEYVFPTDKYYTDDDTQRMNLTSPHGFTVSVAILDNCLQVTLVFTDKLKTVSGDTYPNNSPVSACYNTESINITFS